MNRNDTAIIRRIRFLMLDPTQNAYENENDALTLAYSLSTPMPRLRMLRFIADRMTRPN